MPIFLGELHRVAKVFYIDQHNMIVGDFVRYLLKILDVLQTGHSSEVHW